MPRKNVILAAWQRFTKRYKCPGTCPQLLWDYFATYRLVSFTLGGTFMIAMVFWFLAGHRSNYGTLVLAAFLLHVWLGHQWTIRRFERKLKRANYLLCPDCGYDLKGIQEPYRCPECGNCHNPFNVEKTWRLLMETGARNEMRGVPVKSAS